MKRMLNPYKQLCSVVLGLGLFLVASPAWGEATQKEIPDSVLETVRELQIQHRGRVKPFDTFARETVRQLTNQAHVAGADPVETILRITSNPEHWQAQPILAVPYGPLREKVGMEAKATHIAYDQLIRDRLLMRMLPDIVNKQQQDESLSMLENETMDLYGRFVTMNGLLQQEFALVPPPDENVVLWREILKPAGYTSEEQLELRNAWSQLLQALNQGKSGEMEQAASQLSAQLGSIRPNSQLADWRIRLELTYNQSAPFVLARVGYGLAFVLLLLAINPARAKWIGPGMGMLWISFLLHGAGIVTRVVLGQRPPVSNFYETMLWLPFVAVLLALVLERIYRVRFFAAAAAALAAITLLLADHLPLDPAISPVVAVLRSTLWLTIHVLTIVASYGALALATVLAHFTGWFVIRGNPNPKTLEQLDVFSYRCIQVGVVLLSAGIMLGGIWANASWGRFWGWDPKETWALITLLWFLAMLHGRFAGWLKATGMAIGTICGFFLLLMTYYGVSFYLIGLHSYAGANAKPIPLLLILYVIAEVVFMVVVALRARRLPA